ncbi:hypothetical protein V496_05072 [Pseudogymnoascus sp. VKM F-4515 (FW-2607)]|nr:hypothetical protein V496_05072 [Pseudogymnoascus sp. VKM F-4515 (FW-2607)]
MAVRPIQESGPDAIGTPSLAGLRSVKSTHKLNQINSVRANGVGIPRLGEPDKERFHSYHRVLADFSKLPTVISDAASLMRIRGHDSFQDGPAFGADVLRIEVVGNTGLHLTVVDLPGLIAVNSDEQSHEDVEVKIIQRAQKFDKAGQRTVGIITKADLINKNTEPRIALLAKNIDTTKLKLGYFLLKNPTPSQLDAGISLDKRRRDEHQFFCLAAWKDQQLDMDRVGIESLRTFLQDLLEQHIERELPKVRAEIKALMLRKESEIASLGDERPTVGHMRMFLTRLSMRFHTLAQAALDGNYHVPDLSSFNRFDELESSTCLRAEVHCLNGEFAANISSTSSLVYRVELQKIIDDEKRQPITYNHYYTDNIQNARHESLKKAIQKAMKVVVDEDWHGKFHISNNQLDSEKLLTSLQKRVVVNMDDQACSEALAGLAAYYKVALKTFVDNVCRQVIERHILSNLSNVFSPTTVMSFLDKELLRIASEPET